MASTSTRTATQHARAPPVEAEVETFLVRALFDYRSTEASALNFRAGDIIDILGRLDSGWWDGVIDGQRGWLPSNYVERLSDAESLRIEQERQDDEGTPSDDDYPADDVPDLYSSKNIDRSPLRNGGDLALSNNGFGLAQRYRDAGRSQELYAVPNTSSATAKDSWFPRATADGQIYFENPQTGETRQDLPDDLDGHSDAGSDLPSQSQDPYLSTSSSITSLTSPPHPNGNGHGLVSLSAFDDPNSFAPRQRLPSPWQVRTTEDGAAVYYVNSQTGEKRANLPMDGNGRPSSSGFDPSRSSTRASNFVDLSDRRLEEDEDEEDGRPSTSTDVSGRGDLVRRKLRALDDSSSVGESEGTPALALKVRTAIKALKESVSGSPLPPLSPSSAFETTQEEFELRTYHRIEDALEAVISSTRGLVCHSGVLALPTLPLDLSGTVTPISSSQGGPAPSPSSLGPSEQLRISHRKVQAFLMRLIFSVRRFLHRSDWYTADEAARAPVRQDAEDMERVVVAFGLEVVDRDRAGRNSSGPTSTSDYRRPRRLRASLDSVGINLPVSGRNGFALEVDADQLVKPFGLESGDPQLKGLIDRAVKSIEAVERAFADPEVDLIPFYYDLLGRLTSIMQYVRGFNIAAAIDLDGEETPSLRNEGYARDVSRARSLLREYESALDSLAEGSGWLLASFGILVETDIQPAISSLRTTIKILGHSFLGLWEISFAQAQAVRTGVQGRIGRRRPVAVAPQLKRAHSRARSIGSLRSQESGSSRRSRLMSLRSKAGSTSLGLDQEISETEQLEEERRDNFDTNGGLPTASASMGSISRASRPRNGSVGGMSTSSSSQSTLYDNQGFDPRASTLSGRTNGGSSWRESNELRPSSYGSSESPAPARNDGKLQKVFGESALPEPEPWYLCSDLNENDIVYSEAGRDEIKGATIQALIVKLTNHVKVDLQFQETFLMTYKSFVSASDLLDLLIERCRLSPPPGLEADELFRWTQEKQSTIRVKVSNAIRAWIETYLAMEDEGILDEVDRLGDVLPPALLSPILKAVANRRSRGASTGPNSFRKNSTLPGAFPPTSKVSKQLSKVLDVDPLELARQLSLMEAALFREIRPFECLGKSWSNTKDPLMAPNIKAAIKMSNEMSRWVTGSILAENTPKGRAAIVKFWIQVADKSLTLNNFATVAAIVAGATFSSITRMKRTMDLLSPKTVAMRATLTRAIAADRNFAAYRSALQSVQPPGVPFLGVYLTDLTFVEDGNPDFLAGERKLINWGKRLKAASTLRDISNYQQLTYNLQEVPMIQTFIRDQLRVWGGKTEQEIYDRSKQVEPREQEPERITRMLSESGFL